MDDDRQPFRADIDRKPGGWWRHPVLRAMLAELQRSKTQLKLPDAQAPYYIDYRLQDVDQYVAEAAFGRCALLCGHASACCASWCG